MKKSFETYKNMKADRMVSYRRFQMARDIVMSDFNNAIQLFADVANLCRQEGRVALLWELLGNREFWRKLGSVNGFIQDSLEMAALLASSIAGQGVGKFGGPVGPAPANLPQRCDTQGFFGLLIRGVGIS